MIDDKLLHRWIQGQLSPEELESFKKRPEYPDLEKVYRHTEGLQAPVFVGESILKNILAEPKKETPVRSMSLPRITIYAAAASVLLLIGWFFWPNEAPLTTVVAQGAERVEFALPDGSKVHLNAESSLVYQANEWPQNRALELEGEAFFSVQKGSDFLVQTPYGLVQVLGTQFNVRARDGYLEVGCQSGKVQVNSPRGDQPVALTPGQGVRLEEGQKPLPLSLPANQEPSWLDGIYRFKDVPLAVPLAELERQFGIEIERVGLDEEQLIRCNFQTENLDLALSTVLGPTGYSYQIENGNRVRIFK